MWHPLPSDFSFQESEHVYTAGGEVRLSVTQNLTLSGRIDTRWFKPFDAWRGTYVHTALHYDSTGDLADESVRPELMGYVDAGRRAIRELGLTIIEAEKRIWIPAYSIPGTLDLIARQRNGRLCILDWKTGAIGLWVRLQLAAYCAGSTQPYLFDRIAVRLSANGKYSCKFYGPETLRSDLNEFYGDAAKAKAAWITKTSTNFGERSAA